MTARAGFGTEGDVRAGRLLTLLTVLQDHPGSSAPVLAGRCGVSLRTVYRDLEALMALGFPVRFAGGYRLLLPDLVPPIAFTPEEALAARAALAPLNGPAARAASAKLAALAEPAPPGAPRGQLPLDLHPAPDAAAASRLSDLSRAAAERRVARVTEGRAARPAREITLEPYRVVFGRGHWWVLGYAPARRRLIAMAADRIRSVRVLRRGFRPREGVRPERALARLGSGPAAPCVARLRLAPAAAPLASGIPSRWLARHEAAPDGSSRLTVAVPHPEQLILWALAAGDGVEVLEPPALRAELARRGRRLVERYATGPPPD